jgi:TonB family protein
MVIAIAAFAVLTAYGAIEWSSHRNPTLPAKVAENDLTHSSANQGLDQSEMSSDSGTHAAGQPLLTRSEFRPQDRGVVRTVPTTLSASQAGTQGGGAMSQPAIRASNDVAGVYKATASPGGATQTPGPVPSGLQNTPPNNTTSVLKDNSTVQSTLAAQKPRISAGGAQGLVIRPVAPLYPASARQAHIEGTVVLQAVIGKDGNVQTVRVVSGHPMLIQAAVNAAKQWHFNPYYQDGEPVEADTQINVNFTLQAD